MTNAAGFQETYQSVYAHLSDQHEAELAQYVQIMKAQKPSA